MGNCRLFFLSFADSRYRSASRIGKEAKAMEVFDAIVVGDESLFEPWYAAKYQERFSDRGFGFWQWKSYLIKRTLNEMAVGEVLVYADAGCTLNPQGLQRLKEYVELTQKSACGIVAFEQSQPEWAWTKVDMFDYFGVATNEQYLHHGQTAATTMIIRKCDEAMALVEEWYSLCHDHYDLISDAPSHRLECDGFCSHRHDQSAFSMLCVKHHALELSIEEIYTENDWTTMVDYPIWATRKRDTHKTMQQKLVIHLKRLLSR